MYHCAGLPERPVLYPDLETLEGPDHTVWWSTKLFANLQKHRLIYRQVKVRFSIVAITNPLHCNNKVSGFPIPSQDVIYKTLPGRE
jgi:hypothetical protein